MTISIDHFRTILNEIFKMKKYNNEHDVAESQYNVDSKIQGVVKSGSINQILICFL